VGIALAFAPDLRAAGRYGTVGVGVGSPGPLASIHRPIPVVVRVIPTDRPLARYRCLPVVLIIIIYPSFDDPILF
jgi:hypothetical protein